MRSLDRPYRIGLLAGTQIFVKTSPWISFEAILVVVDRLSRYANFLLLKHPYIAKGVTKVFAKEVVCLHGILNSIVSDQDPFF